MSDDPRPGFFADRPPEGVGLAVFLTAGDPPLSRLPELTAALDESGVDCLELAVPFPDSVTDGPVIRRAARRALAAGTTAGDVLAAVARLRGAHSRLRIALLADWAHTVRPAGHGEFLSRVAAAGADALLVHGLPPVARAAHHRLAHELGVPLVTTCYPTSPPATMADAAANASAYLYLVAHHGRTGTTAPAGFGHLTAAVRTLRAATSAPIAVGFGVRDRAGVAAVADLGADAAVVGTAATSVVEHALTTGRDVAADLRAFVTDLRPAPAVGTTRPHPGKGPA